MHNRNESTVQRIPYAHDDSHVLCNSVIPTIHWIDTVAVRVTLTGLLPMVCANHTYRQAPGEAPGNRRRRTVRTRRTCHARMVCSATSSAIPKLAAWGTWSGGMYRPAAGSMRWSEPEAVHPCPGCRSARPGGDTGGDRASRRQHHRFLARAGIGGGSYSLRAALAYRLGAVDRGDGHRQFRKQLPDRQLAGGHSVCSTGARGVGRRRG